MNYLYKFNLLWNNLRCNHLLLLFLDMDGTFFGEALLPGALEFLDWLNEKEIKFNFLTNNTSKGKQAYVSFLTGLCARSGRAHLYLQAMRPSVI